MSTPRIPPEDFVRRLKAQCGSDWDVRFNEEVNRWEFLSTSAGGMRVSQFLGWFVNPLTGERLEPDPITGLLPFRDLTPDAQEEVLRNLDVSFLGNRADGAGTFKRQFEQRIRYNKAIQVESAKKRGQLYADLIHEVNLARPWKKEHERNKGPKIYVG